MKNTGTNPLADSMQNGEYGQYEPIEDSLEVVQESMMDIVVDNDDEDDLYRDIDEDPTFAMLKQHAQMEDAQEADRLSMRLLAVPDDDPEEEDRILRESLQLLEKPAPEPVVVDGLWMLLPKSSIGRVASFSGLAAASPSIVKSGRYRNMFDGIVEEVQMRARRRILIMMLMFLVAISVVGTALYVSVEVVVGPPNQPVGPYQLIELQEGEEFFDHYAFYRGPDSAGSNGYNMYVSRKSAFQIGIADIVWENDPFSADDTKENQTKNSDATSDSTSGEKSQPVEPFVYMASSATADGPRDSIRLEGLRRFDRGLFIIDLRHMPAGCGVWPAFWMTDEVNWPINGEIDIVEGVNYQTQAKTALHSTQGCSMYDIPEGTMTGGWDTAQGIPDAKTGIPDMTLRYARDCFVYNPKQWLNQGCVAVDFQDGSIGQPFNAKGGGVYVLEWDPINRHIRTWVFTPHTSVPQNLRDALRTAKDKDPVLPDPREWPLPYGYFAIGTGTSCPSKHFKRMRLVFNTAFCGSVAGNRYFLDCPLQAKNYSSCNDWIKSEPEELKEAYWKIRGVYVYEREWERKWLDY